MDRRHSLAVIGVLLVTALVYLPALWVGYRYEDGLWQSRLSVVSETGRPLTVWSQRLTEDRPVLAHAVSLGLHLVNGGLVMAVAGTVLPVSVAVAAGAVFLWHPLNVEAVAYLNGRSDLLVTLGLLLTLLGALCSWWMVVLAGVLVALSAKEIGLTAVVIPWAVMIWRYRGVWDRFPTRYAVFAVSGTTLLTLVYLDTIRVWLAIARDRAEFVALQWRAVGELLTLSVWPFGLSIDHDALALSAWPMTLAALLIVAAVIGGRKHPAVWLSLLLVACAVAPRFLVFYRETINEHQFYPAMAGLSLGLTWLCVTGWDWATTFEQRAMVAPPHPSLF